MCIIGVNYSGCFVKIVVGAACGRARAHLIDLRAGILTGVAGSASPSFLGPRRACDP